MGQPGKENSGRSREESVGKTEGRENNLESSGWFHKQDLGEQYTRALVYDERIWAQGVPAKDQSLRDS